MFRLGVWVISLFRVVFRLFSEFRLVSVVVGLVVVFSVEVMVLVGVLLVFSSLVWVVGRLMSIFWVRVGSSLLFMCSWVRLLLVFVLSDMCMFLISRFCVFLLVVKVLLFSRLSEVVLLNFRLVSCVFISVFRKVVVVVVVLFSLVKEVLLVEVVVNIGVGFVFRFSVMIVLDSGVMFVIIVVLVVFMVGMVECSICGIFVVFMLCVCIISGMVMVLVDKVRLYELFMVVVVVLRVCFLLLIMVMVVCVSGVLMVVMLLSVGVLV